MGSGPRGASGIAQAPELTLVDTSAWVEFLRGTGSPVALHLRGLLETRTPLATTEPIVIELLAGARDDVQLRSLRRLVLGGRLMPVRGLADYEEAAAIYRRCRRAGLTVRRLVDCLIAAVAINANAVLLQADSDFDLIAQRTSLRLARPQA